MKSKNILGSVGKGVLTVGVGVLGGLFGGVLVGLDFADEVLRRAEPKEGLDLQSQTAEEYLKSHSEFRAKVEELLGKKIIFEGEPFVKGGLVYDEAWPEIEAKMMDVSLSELDDEPLEDPILKALRTDESLRQHMEQVIGMKLVLPGECDGDCDTCPACTDVGSGTENDDPPAEPEFRDPTQDEVDVMTHPLMAEGEWF